MKKRLLITAAILTSFGLAILIGALIISNFDVSRMDITKYETNTYNVSEDFEKIMNGTYVEPVTVEDTEEE